MAIELIEDETPEQTHQYTLDDFIPDLESWLTRLEKEASEIAELTGSPGPVSYSTMGFNGSQVEKIEGVDSLVFGMDFRPSTCAALKDFAAGTYSWTNRKMPIYVRMTQHLVCPINEAFITTLLKHQPNETLHLPIIRVHV